MVKINKKMSLVFILAITLFLAMSTLSAADSNSTSDTTTTNSLETSTTNTDHSNSQDNSNNIDHNSNSADSSISNKDTSTISTSTSHSSSDNTKTENSVKEVTTKTNTTTSSSTNQTKEVTQQNTTNTSQSNTVNNKTSLKQDSAIATDYSDLKDKVADESIDEINLDSDVKYTATSTITIDRTLTINGNGATIDGDNLSKILIVSYSGNLTIKNVNIKNCNNSGNYAGAIYNYGILSCDNLSLFNNTASYGGAIFNNGILNINNSSFYNNTAYYGGAIESSGGNLTIENSNFYNNTARNYGGSLYINSFVIISDTTFTNNYADRSGGAIYNYNGNLTIFDSIFTNNIADTNGGAIYSFNRTLDIITSIFDKNMAQYGGVLYNNNSITLLDSSIFKNNNATNGGSIYNNYELTIKNSTFYENTAEMNGGAIYNSGDMNIVDSIFNYNYATFGGAINGGTITINKTTFTNNIARTYGGAIDSYNLTIHDSILANNTANSNGGAIYSSGNLLIDNSTLYNNTSKYGGAIYSSGNLLIDNSTIFNNTSDSYGGAIYNEGSSSNITNSIIIQNSATSYGGAIFSNSQCTVINSTISDNNARFGSGITNYYEFTIIESILYNNKATLNGGAIYNYGNMTINQSTLINNIAEEDAGSIYNNANLTMINSNVLDIDKASNSITNMGNISLNNNTILKILQGGINEDTHLTSPLYDFTLNNTENIEIKINNETINVIPDNGTVNLTYNFTSTGENIVSFNYPSYENNNIGLIIQTSSETTTTYYVTNYEELVKTVNFIKSLTSDKNYTVILLENDDPTAYYITETITWGNSNTPTNLTIKGNGVTITGVDINQFVIVNEQYTLNVEDLTLKTLGNVIYNNGTMTITNITITNNTSTKNGSAIDNYGYLEIYDSIINNQSSVYGGAIHNFNASLNIINSTFSNNFGDFGGAIFNSQSNLTIIDSTFNNNTVTLYGGAISTNNGFINLTNSTFNSNSAIYGGAFHNGILWGDCNITNCTFINNEAEYGGSIHCDDSSILKISESMFKFNSAIYGGAIYSYYSNLTIYDTEISSNDALNGGGIYKEGDGSTLTINNTYFNDNAASFSGGAIYVFNNSRNNMKGIVKISNSSLMNNSALYGGAISNNEESFINVNNCSFSGNIADYGGAIYNYETSNVTIMNSKFMEDSAYYGGCIYNDGNASISKNTFENIQGLSLSIGDYYRSYGGSIYNNGNLNITESEFINSSVGSEKQEDKPAYGYGGSIYNHGNITLTKTSFVNNSFIQDEFVEQSYGEIIYNVQGTMIIENCTFEKNSASVKYSSVESVIYNNGNMSINNSIFRNNDLDDYSIVANYKFLNITNSVFKENDVSWNGLIYNQKNLTIINSTFSNNTSWDQKLIINNDNNLTIINSTFIDNRVSSSIIINYANIIIYESKFINNTGYNSNNFPSVVSNEGNATIVNSYFLSDGTKNIISNYGTLILTGNQIIIDKINISEEDETVIIKSPIQENDLENTSVNYVINNEDNGNVTYISGEFIFENNFKSGNNTVSLNYTQNYPSNNIIVIVYVKGEEVILEIDPISTTYLNNTINITGTLKTKEGVALGNQYLEINVNGIIIGEVTTNSTGGYIIEYTTNIGGINNITVFFKGFESYESFTNTTTFEVSKISTKLTISNDDYSYPGDLKNIFGTLTDINNNVIVGVNVTITIYDEEITTLTDEYGNYYIIYNTTTIGTLEITVTFEGNDYYLPSTTSSIMEVIHESTTINMTEINDTTINSIINITGKVLDSDGFNINNATVTLYVNGEEVSTTVTNSSGYLFSYNVTSIGVNNITVVYDGSYRYISSTNSTSFNVTRLYSKISLSFISDKIVGETTIIKGSLLDENDTAIPYSSLIIEINGEFFITITNGSGEYSINYIPTVAGTNNITITFEGSDRYCSACINGTFTVLRINTTLSLDSIGNTSINDTVKISGSLKDVNGTGIPDANILLKINNDIISITTDNNGIFTYYYKTTITGINNISVTYSENEKYNSSRASTTFNVTEFSKIPTNINLNSIGNTSYGDFIRINGTITDTEGNIISNTYVIFTINGNELTLITDSEGVFTYEYKATIVGTNNITVIFEENDKYTSSSISMTFTVTKQNTTITINSINSTNLNETIQITGTLKDKNNNIIPYATITIQVNNITYTTTTNNNGIYILNYITTTTGTNNITITYTGNENYTSTNTSITFNVSKINTNISLNSISDTTYGNMITITGSLKDIYGNYITNANIILIINQEKINLTTNNGVFTYNYNATTIGTNNVTAIFEENNKYTTSNVSTTFNVSKINTTITLNSINNNTVGSTITITGTLKETNGYGIPYTEITLTINGNKITVTTNINGTFNYNYTTTTVGTNNITATYDGNYKYTSSSTSTTFPLSKLNTTITINSINSTNLNETIQITGTLKDKNNNIIPYATITIQVNNITYTTTTNNNGVYTLNYTTTTTGTNNITITYTGNENYTSTNTSTTFTVLKLNTTISVNSISDITYGNIVIVSGSLKDTNGNNIKNTNVVLIINQEKINLTTNSNGVFTYNFNATTVGINNITVTFDGNSNYTSSNVSATFNVSKINTTITLNSINNNTVGSTITISGTLKETKGYGIPYTEITLTINGNKIILSTDINGTFTYEYNTTTVGTNNITATYNGNYKYTSSSTSDTFYLSKVSSTITINSIGNTTLGNTITVSGTLKDTNGNNISDANIDLSINGDSIVVKTNSNGVYSYQYTTTKTGINNITATYDGDNYYISSSTKTTFNVLNVASNLVIEQITTKNGYTVTLTAKVTDFDGNPINIGQATFKLNGVTMKDNGTQIKVDVVNGLAQYNFTIPNYSAKEYKLTAVYGYLDTRLEDSTTLVILKSDPELKLTSITSNGTTGKITGMLLDEHGVGVDRETKVSVKINGKTILSTRIYEGVIDLEFNTSAYKNGIHNLTVIFGENGCYNTVTYEGAIAQNVKDTIVVNPVTGKNGDVVSFRAYIIDESGNSATNGSATFKLNGVTVKENGTQIKVNFVNGVAEYNFTIPDYSAKDYNLTAVASVGATRYEAQSVLTIEKTDTHVQLNPITITQGSNATVTGSILDEHNNPITIDTKVSVKINGKTVSNTRVYDGLIDVPIDTSSYSKGNYTIDFVAGENGRYNKSTGSTTLIIE